jgi:hypothetical protein
MEAGEIPTLMTERLRLRGIRGSDASWIIRSRSPSGGQSSATSSPNARSAWGSSAASTPRAAIGSGRRSQRAWPRATASSPPSRPPPPSSIVSLASWPASTCAGGGTGQPWTPCCRPSGCQPSSHRQAGTIGDSSGRSSMPPAGTAPATRRRRRTSRSSRSTSCNSSTPRKSAARRRPRTCRPRRSLSSPTAAGSPRIWTAPARPSPRRGSGTRRARAIRAARPRGVPLRRSSACLDRSSSA